MSVLVTRVYVNVRVTGGARENGSTKQCRTLAASAGMFQRVQRCKPVTGVGNRPGAKGMRMRVHARGMAVNNAA